MAIKTKPNINAMRVAFFFVLMVVFIAPLTAPLSNLFQTQDEFQNGTALASSDKIVIETEVQVSGLGKMQGGGYITWKFSGSAATELRTLILNRYDGIVKPGSNPPESRRDDTLQDYEVDAFIGNGKDVEKTLQSGLAEWNYWGVKRTGGFQPAYSKQTPITPEDCAGLIGTGRTSNENIIIYWIFDITSTMEEEEVNFRMHDQKLLWAIYKPLELNHGDDHYNNSIAKYSVTFKHTEYILGLQSIYNPDIADGTMWAVRTPIAELVWYEYPAKKPESSGTGTFSMFNFIENGAILFVFIFILSEITFWIIDRIYQKYREKAMEKTDDRVLWKKKFIVHLAFYLMFIFLWVFYFFPGLGFIFIGGLFLWFYGITISVVSCVISKIYYDRRLEKIPVKRYTPPQIPQPVIQPAPVQQTPTPIHLHVTVAGTSGKGKKPRVQVQAQPQTNQVPQNNQPPQIQHKERDINQNQNEEIYQKNQNRDPYQNRNTPPSMPQAGQPPGSPQQPTTESRPKNTAGSDIRKQPAPQDKKSSSVSQPKPKNKIEDENPLEYKPARPPGFTGSKEGETKEK